MTYNTTAIILRRETFREADLSVSLLSREHGKIRAVAIGAKKIGSKLAGQLEPARELRLMLAPGKSFDKIGQAILVDNFNLKSGLERLYSAQKAGGLVDKLMPEHQKEAEVYGLLKNFLSGRQNYLFFSIRLLALTGHQPELQKCLVCKKPPASSVGRVESANEASRGKPQGIKRNSPKLPVLRSASFGGFSAPSSPQQAAEYSATENNFFNFDRGGLICQPCGQKLTKEKQEEISPEIVEGWRAGKTESDEVSKKLLNLIEEFIQYRIF